MKKLPQKHSKKDKKKESGSKKRGSNSPESKAPAKRRRIIEAISRDELPKIDMKFSDLERVMNDRFTDVLKSLQSKNETVEKENVTKESHKEGHHSDDVADFEGNSDPISPNFVMKTPHKMKIRQDGDSSENIVHVAGSSCADSPVKEMDKSVEMEEDKFNQALSHFTSCEQQEKDDGIEKLSDIIVEEIKPIDSVFPVQGHEMALTIYKPPPPTPDEYMISDTAIVSAFSTPKKIVSEVKKTPAQWNRKPSKIFHSPFLTHFGSSTKGKIFFSTERKKYPFEGYDINGNSPNVEIEVFEEWIKEGLYRKDKDDHYKYLDVIMYYLRKKYKNKNFPSKRYTTKDCFFKVYIDKAYMNYYDAGAGKELATQDASAKTDEVADMEMTLINTIKGSSPHIGQPWHLVDEFFVPINCDGAFHWILAVIALKDRCIHVYDSMASSRKRTQTSEIEKDCGVFVSVYAEYLSEGLDISSSKVDAHYHRLRYASILCKYGSVKAENGYFSENDDLQRPRMKTIKNVVDDINFDDVSSV
ncbi:uncharacterized protein LOC107879154 [Capsicum annuum]|uniref:uncharacterized protein LOC107879154 n=1 Tax=Capsicum annuum TaxID=4072 RepID=UPI001FB04B06|nr:uncharacterized protein LOC107879154 [Capsicum annuum]